MIALEGIKQAIKNVKAQKSPCPEGFVNNFCRRLPRFIDSLLGSFALPISKEKRLYWPPGVSHGLH